MAGRILLGLITLFWVTMNFLLWRAEYGLRGAAAETVPVSLVWRKILTAPDPSSLGIWQGEQRLGFGHWVTSVGEEFAELEEAPPVERLDRLGNPRLRLDGNLNLPGENLRLRYECALKLASSQHWQEFTLRLSAKSLFWELRSVAAEETVQLRWDDGERAGSRVIRFAELRNPAALVAEFAGPAGIGLLAALGVPPVATTNAPSLPALKWEASSVVLNLRLEPVRVYLLQTRLLDRFEVRIHVSRAGEILRVELPNNIVLKHDQIRLGDSARHD